MKIMGIMKTNSHRFVFLLWMLAIICTTTAIIGLVAMPSSDMRLWGVRLLIFKSLGWSVLIHLSLAVLFLLLRKWISAISTLLLSLLFFGATLIAGLTIGPDLKTVRQKVSALTGVTTSELECVGGRLSRESVVVFKVAGIAPFSDVGEEISDETNIRSVLVGVLRSLRIHPTEPTVKDIKKFPMEFNTVFALCTNDGWWIVFFGNAIM